MSNLKYPMVEKIIAEHEIEAEMIKRKSGKSSPRGLWDNIRDKQKRGEKPRKPGSPGAPTRKAFEKSKAK